MPAIRSKYTAPPSTADLNDPLYYRTNFETVIRWVREHHHDLLLESEIQHIDELLNLPPAARGLLARMVMRTGELFREEKLNYPELEQSIPEAMSSLVMSGWVEPEPDLTLPELFRLFTLAELRPALADMVQDAGLKRTAPKSQLMDALTPLHPDATPVRQWLPGTNTLVRQLNRMPLFDRLRLMFFGNLRQSWSDFVLVELGHQRYEAVPFSSEARAFDCRDDVDRYLVMHHCRERLDAGESPEVIWQDIPDAGDNAWLESRRGRLLFELAKQAERGGQTSLALSAYDGSQHRDARLRQLRLMERQGQYQAAWDLAEQATAAPRSESELQGLQRLQNRLGKKLGQPSVPKKPRPTIPKFELELANPEGHSVEWCVLSHLSTEAEPVAYVENTLITGLFSLLCWPAVFAPIPGAFFHPFHTGPVDLYREDFIERRRDLFDACLRSLEDGRYKDIIRKTWREKYGIASPFVVWPVLSEALLELALHCLPADHLIVLFKRLMADLRLHRSGFPDLIRFMPAATDPHQRYEMIEVKGPGDRLQDHQTQWLEYCVDKQIPVSVCYVRWQSQETGP